MKSILQVAVSLFSLLTLASAQGERFCESDVCFTRFSQSGVSVGFVFPPGGDGDRPNEFLGIIQAPSNFGWVGLSLSGPMVDSLLLVGWVDGSTGRLSSRIARDYVPPTAYGGPQITVFQNLTRKDGGGQRIVFRCQGCSSWDGGQINVPEWEIGWAAAGAGPSNAGDAGSGVPRHTETGFGVLRVERSSSYQQYVSRLQGGGSPPPPPSSSGGGASSTSGSATASRTTASGSETASSSGTATGTDTSATSTSTDTTSPPSETEDSSAMSLSHSSSLIGLLAGAGLWALL